MALDFQGLKDDLLVAFTLGEEINPDSEQLLLDQMEAIARAIETYVKSGKVNTTVTVTTTGQLTPPSNVAGTGTGTGTGSIE